MNKQSNIQDKINECEIKLESLKGQTWKANVRKDRDTLNGKLEAYKEAQEIINEREKEILEIIDKFQSKYNHATSWEVIEELKQAIKSEDRK